MYIVLSTPKKIHTTVIVQSYREISKLLLSTGMSHQTTNHSKLQFMSMYNSKFSCNHGVQNWFDRFYIQVTFVFCLNNRCSSQHLEGASRGYWSSTLAIIFYLKSMTLYDVLKYFTTSSLDRDDKEQSQCLTKL